MGPKPRTGNLCPSCTPSLIVMEETGPRFLPAARGSILSRYDPCAPQDGPVTHPSVCPAQEELVEGRPRHLCLCGSTWCGPQGAVTGV